MRDVPASKYAEDAGPFISLGYNRVCGGGANRCEDHAFLGLPKASFLLFFVGKQLGAYVENLPT